MELLSPAAEITSHILWGPRGAVAPGSWGCNDFVPVFPLFEERCLWGIGRVGLAPAPADFQMSHFSLGCSWSTGCNRDPVRC